MQLTTPHLTALGNKGYFVDDAFLSLELSQKVRAESLALIKRKLLAPSSVGRSTRQAAPTVRSDRTMWVSEEDTLWHAISPSFSALQQALNEGAYLGLSRFDLQLAEYPGEGSHYVRHKDAFLGGNPNRRVTSILYLNSDWSPAQGGQLRLHLANGTRDIEPVLGRLVVFLSEHIEHEVLPAYFSRLALTAWYYGP